MCRIEIQTPQKEMDLRTIGQGGTKCSSFRALYFGISSLNTDALHGAECEAQSLQYVLHVLPDRKHAM